MECTLPSARRASIVAKVTEFVAADLSFIFNMIHYVMPAFAAVCHHTDKTISFSEISEPSHFECQSFAPYVRLD